jgi:hypothetical protein
MSAVVAVVTMVLVVLVVVVAAAVAVVMGMVVMVLLLLLLLVVSSSVSVALVLSVAVVLAVSSAPVRLLLGAEGRFPSHCSAPLARSARVSISRGGCRPGAHLRCPAPPAFLLAAGS